MLTLPGGQTSCMSGLPETDPPPIRSYQPLSGHEPVSRCGSPGRATARCRYAVGHQATRSHDPIGFKHIAAEASPRLVGFGGLPDELWRINLEGAGSHMVRSGLFTEAELDECLNLLDTHILLISGILESRRGPKTICLTP